MKKGWLLINLIFMGAVLFACDNPVQKDIHYIYVMDTTVTVDFSRVNIDDKNKHYENIEAIYNSYDKVSDNYRGYEGINNVYYINQQAELSEASATVEITKELFELISYAYEIQMNSKGYFNITMGKIIDIWKNDIIDNEDYQIGGLPDNIIEETLEAVANIEIIEDPISLMQTNDKYYITLKKGAKIDLGAIAKGYATQKVNEYLKENNIRNHMISGGSSSIILGEKNDTTPDYVIGLSNPFYDEFSVGEQRYFGAVNVSHTSITTSGSNLQKVVDKDGNWYHHIISPLSKKPENLYYSITLIADDAALLDAYSTALFSMPLEEIKSFLKDQPNIEVIIYDINREVIVINETGRFESWVNRT